MHQKNFFIIFVFFFLPLFVSGEENVLLKLKDANTNYAVNNILVHAEIDEQQFEQYVNDTILRFLLGEGAYNFVLVGDDPSTPKKDYFKRFNLSIKGPVNEDVYLQPVGSLTGFVTDNRENLVGGADLNFECAKEGDISLPATTNDYGYFSADYLPVGDCKIFVSHKNSLGVVKVKIKQGELLDEVKIVLNKKVANSANTNRNLLFLFGIALIFAIFLGFKFLKNKKNVKPANKRINDLMVTLKDKEKEVVNYLLENNYESTQSKICYSLLIPKTSMIRIIKSLEEKRVVEVEVLGKKFKKIKLTNFFLGK